MNYMILTTSLFLASCSTSTRAKESLLLEDFKKGESTLSWQAVNDGVMGGLSKGRPILNKSSTMSFKGEISLENNGGFSSIRTFGQAKDLSVYSGLELRLKGDGRTYFVTLRSPDNKRIAYWSAITPEKGIWQVIKVPFDSFYPTWFGKKVQGLQLKTQKINSIGFMLYDKEAGKFNLDVDLIRCYR